MSISAKALNAIWMADTSHSVFSQFVSDLGHVRNVPLHWPDKQASVPPPALSARPTGLQAALARAGAARPSEHTSTFVTRAQSYAFVSAAGALALLSLFRGDVASFARIVGAAPQKIIAELFFQSQGAHVFDRRSIWSTLEQCTKHLDISNEHFLAHKKLIGQVIADFLSQHWYVQKAPQAQLFLQRA